MLEFIIMSCFLGYVTVMIGLARITLWAIKKVFRTVLSFQPVIECLKWFKMHTGSRNNGKDHQDYSGLAVNL